MADVQVLGLSKNFLDPFPTYKKEFLRSTNRSFYNPWSSRTLSKQKDGGEITTSTTYDELFYNTNNFVFETPIEEFFWKI